MAKKLMTLVSVLTLLLAACGGGSETTTTQPQEPANTEAGSTTTGAGGGSQSITVTLADVNATTMLLTPSPTSAPAGEVTFEITNTGDTIHEFVVLKTDLAFDALPTNDTGSEVLEDAPELTLVDEVEDIQPGETKTLTVTLDAGSYALICNLKGHYRNGMRAAFTVN